MPEKIFSNVLLPNFTIPEMESERKLSLSFWITFATSERCVLGAGKVKPFFRLNVFTKENWITSHLKPMLLSHIETIYLICLRN